MVLLITVLKSLPIPLAIILPAVIAAAWIKALLHGVAVRSRTAAMAGLNPALGRLFCGARQIWQVKKGQGVVFGPKACVETHFGQAPQSCFDGSTARFNMGLCLRP